MKKLNKREMLFFIMFGVVVAVFVVIQLVINPMREGRNDVINRLRAKQSQMMKAKKFLLMRPYVQQHYGQLEALIGVAGSPSAEMSAIVAKIESSANEANIRIANMQPQRVIKQQGGYLFPVELQVNGQWPNIAKFLSLVQAPPNYYFINELNLEKYADTLGFLHGRIVLSRMRLIDQQKF